MSNNEQKDLAKEYEQRIKTKRHEILSLKDEEYSNVDLSKKLYKKARNKFLAIIITSGIISLLFLVCFILLSIHIFADTGIYFWINWWLTIGACSLFVIFLIPTIIFVCKISYLIQYKKSELKEQYKNYDI